MCGSWALWVLSCSLHLSLSLLTSIAPEKLDQLPAPEFPALRPWQGGLDGPSVHTEVPPSQHPDRKPRSTEPTEYTHSYIEGHGLLV